MRILIAILISVVASAQLMAVAGAAEAPRRVLAFYNFDDDELRFHRLPTLIQMPFNHLGLKLEYHDIANPLPLDAVDDPTIAGVVTWFDTGAIPRPTEFIVWAERMVDAGKKFVSLGDLGFLAASDGSPNPSRERVNRFLERLGFRIKGEWTNVTFDSRIRYRDPEMVDFERPMGGKLPPYEKYEVVRDLGTSHMQVFRGQDKSISDVVITSPRGGFVENGWAYYRDPVFFRTQWFINPFAFIRKVFATDSLPKPDTTTLSGRRIYFSHIDGDGWRNVSLVKGYRKDGIYSGRVILERAIAPYPDLPITVGPIAADLDPAWSGDDEAQQIAREIFALPQVEVSHHTYSHPFEWGFFEDYTKAKEAPFLRLYRINDEAQWGAELLRSDAATTTASLADAYDQPRGFGSKPFDLPLEFGGASRYVEQFAPKGKKANIVLWSGNTSPTPQMIRASREAGLLNLNGGDSRFDPEYPSVTFVPPVGRTFDGEIQIFAVNSNENTYTDLWSGRYFGFQDLILTLKNTENPRRLKGINVYYHMYSGERPAALQALIKNLEFARSQLIAPISASHYAQLAEGFYTTRFESMGPGRWRVLDRGRMQTIRHDNADDRMVDMATAKGVLGYMHHQGNLYVALDEAIAAPEYRLIAKDAAPKATVPSLVDARWHLWDLRRDGEEIRVRGLGYGHGIMRWRDMTPGRWLVEGRQSDGSIVSNTATVGRDGIFLIDVPTHAYDMVEILIRPAAAG
ncbi:MAG: hypothetical protein P1U65_01650 [Minwuia sp.]|nr:hypothetical protein [Minwuia sp.]